MKIFKYIITAIIAFFVLTFVLFFALGPGYAIGCMVWGKILGYKVSIIDNCKPPLFN